MCKFFTTFAPKIHTVMKNRLFIIALLSLTCMCACAETIILRTGARIQGTIVVQNDDVVIIRDAEGARFQYPREDVVHIVADEKPIVVEVEEVIAEPEIKTSKKVTALLEFAGGAAVNPNEAAGAGVGADLLIGTHHIGNKHIFLGGGLGYHGLFFLNDKYHFLPVQVALRMPFIEAKHAPVFGAALGYGIALTKKTNYIGGLYAGIDFGYRYQISPRSSLAVVAFVQFQQAKVKTVTKIEGVEFENKTGRNFVTPGVKLALYF